MASDTKNVKLGVCKVIFDGVDLGYTIGGVEVTVKTDTHQVTVDQFGKTPVNEYIMGRQVTVAAPLAETTLDNMVKIMPGATLSSTGGAAASGTVTVATLPTDGQNIVVNGQVVTFKTVPVGPLDVLIGADATGTAANLAAKLSASADAKISEATYVAAAAVVTVTEKQMGVSGNSFTLSAGTAGADVTLSGATLAGGTDATSKSVVVTTGIGTNLLDLSKELRLHPISKPDADASEDFVVPRAATSGALQFAYKLENERIFNTQFEGYPDPVTGELFSIGA